MIYYKLFITGSITGGVMGAGSLQPSIGAEVGRRYIMLVVHTSCNNSEIVGPLQMLSGFSKLELKIQSSSQCVVVWAYNQSSIELNHGTH